MLLSEQNLHFCAGRRRPRLHHREGPDPLRRHHGRARRPTPPSANSICRSDHVLVQRRLAPRSASMSAAPSPTCWSIDAARARCKLAKVPTTVDNQAIGVHGRARRGRRRAGDALQAIVHGTTTTTNALLERKIAKVGLITTQGLSRRARARPPHAAAALRPAAARFVPLIERELRLEVAERMDADGKVLTPLDEAAVADGARRAARRRLRGGRHPLPAQLHQPGARARAPPRSCAALWPNRLRHRGPRDPVGVSRVRARRDGGGQRLGPAGAATATSSGCAASSRRKGFDRDLLVMQGNGGTISVAARRRGRGQHGDVGPGLGRDRPPPIPAGAAGQFANLITYDMGGTSTDVALIEDGVPHGLERARARIRDADPRADGRRAHDRRRRRLDRLGRRGGHAAGRPGERRRDARARSATAAAAREPTITDANLVLGRLDPDRLLGGRPPGVARRMCAGDRRDRSATPLGLDADAAAAAILRIANDKMAGAIRMVSLSRGHDPRDFALFAFGGAGPLHATALARELGIPTVLVPARPGITNALGCVVADLRHDYRRAPSTSRSSALDDADDRAASSPRRSPQGEATHRARGRAGRASCVASAQRRHAVPGPEPHPAGRDRAARTSASPSLRKAFAAAYWRRFGVELAEIPPVLVNLHTAVIGSAGRRSRSPRSPRPSARRRSPSAQAGERRGVVRRRLAARRRSTPASGCRSTPRSRARRSSSSSTAPRSSSPATRSARTRSAIC